MRRRQAPDAGVTSRRSAGRCRKSSFPLISRESELSRPSAPSRRECCRSHRSCLAPAGTTTDNAAMHPDAASRLVPSTPRPASITRRASRPRRQESPFARTAGRAVAFPARGDRNRRRSFSSAKNISGQPCVATGLAQCQTALDAEALVRDTKGSRRPEAQAAAEPRESRSDDVVGSPLRCHALRVPLTGDMIRESVARYRREQDRYVKLGGFVAEHCRRIVEDNAIRATVQSRAKDPASLALKLRRFMADGLRRSTFAESRASMTSSEHKDRFR